LFVDAGVEAFNNPGEFCAESDHAPLCLGELLKHPFRRGSGIDRKLLWFLGESVDFPGLDPDYIAVLDDCCLLMF
jgi:hypothetical protein